QSSVEGAATGASMRRRGPAALSRRSSGGSALRLTCIGPAAALVCLVLRSGVASAESMSLDSVLAAVRSRNPELRAAARDVDAARQRLRQAGALESSSITYEAGKLGTPVSSEEREASLRLTQSAS